MKKLILAISILMVSLAVHVSAQNRSAKENLKGLQEMGLVVRYDNADGSDAAMQPTILQALQERAETRLKEAGIPFVSSTRVDATAVRPHLDFVVTINKQTDEAPAVLIQSKLYERVRLFRDSVKELEMATWVYSGIGAPKLTRDMPLKVLDMQLDVFIRDYREMNPKPAPAESEIANSAVRISDNANPLQGLKGMRFWVWLRRERGADEKHYAELEEKLRKATESKLADAGIRLLKFSDETERAGNPLLYLAVRLSPPGYHAPPVVVEGALWQWVHPLRDPKQQIHAVTWESESKSGGPITDDAVLQVLNTQLDEFIKAFTEAKNNRPSVAKVKQP